MCRCSDNNNNNNNSKKKKKKTVRPFPPPAAALRLGGLEGIEIPSPEFAPVASKRALPARALSARQRKGHKASSAAVCTHTAHDEQVP